MATASGVIEEVQSGRESAGRTKGGAFLVSPPSVAAAFVPEELDETGRDLREAFRRFMAQEVVPKAGEIEERPLETVPGLLRRAGEEGFLGLGVPEEFGGLGMDPVANTVLDEAFGANGSWAVSVGAHRGIGTLPIVYFGTEEQRRAWLPLLARGEKLAAYALTEPGSGSDALSVRTRADRSPDGSQWILNGSKMWITNAGWADLFVVFAKVDGERFSAFLVERTDAGFEVGHEEHKMGIRGSSTAALALRDCRIPADRLLGEIGRGHKIAFNILNIGRFKLGAGVVGAARTALDETIRYTGERVQFGRPIREFGAVRSKLAEMAARLYAGESLVYRNAGALRDLGETLRASGLDPQRAELEAIEELAVECSIAKVYCSEALDFVVDEAVQCHGGYGFSEEYAVCRMYRDSRINRIFEGTNEINKLLVPGMLLRRALAGRLHLVEAAQAAADRLLAPPELVEPQGPLGAEWLLLADLKELVLVLMGAAFRRFGEGLEERQEIMGWVAEIVIALYALESALARAERLAATGHAGAPLAADLARLCAEDACERTAGWARRAASAIGAGDEERLFQAAVRRRTRYACGDQAALRQGVAVALGEAGRYPLG